MCCAQEASASATAAGQSFCRKCRHCGEPALDLVHLPYGCFVFPEDMEQWLCPYHLDRLESIPHRILERL